MSMSFRFKRGVSQAGLTVSALAALFACTGPAAAQLPAVSVFGSRTPVNGTSTCAATGIAKISRDLAGNIYALNTTTKCILEIPVSGPVQTVVPSTDASMTVAPTSFTVDPFGNIYVTHNSDAIQTIPRLSTGVYNTAAETSTTPFGGVTFTNGYYNGNDIAVDSLGNIYAASSGGNTVGTWVGKGIMMYGPSTGNVPRYLVSVTSAYPTSLQVDAAGNVFYADGALVYEIPAATVSATISSGTPLATGTAIATGAVPNAGSGSSFTFTPAPMTTPKWVYLDPAGNVYVGNANNADYVIVNSSTGYSASSAVYYLPGITASTTSATSTTNGPIIGKSGYTSGAIDNQGNFYLNYSGTLEFYGGGRQYIVGSSGTNTFPTTVAVAANGQSATTIASGASLGLLFSATTTLNATTPFVASAGGSAFGGAGVSEITYNTAGGTTCVAGATYTAGQSCNVEIGFGPHYPGGFETGLNVINAAGNIVTTIYGNGVGSGPAATIDTGVAALVGTGYAAPLGVAVDNTGAMYVADPTAGKVYKYAAGASTSTAGTAVGTGFTTPSGVAIDAGGNLFVVDPGSNSVSYLQNNNGTLGTQGPLATPGFTLNAPRGIAVDSYGNVYIADTGNARVLMVPNPLIGAVGKIVTVGSGFTAPYGIAIDGFNNVYVADKGAGKIFEVPGGYNTAAPATSNVGTGAITTIGSFSAPTGVAVDGSGTVYVADGSLAQVVKVPFTAGAFGTQTALFTAAATGISAPAGIAVDRTGDLYFTDNAQPGLYFAQRSEASGSAKVTLPLPNAMSTSSTTANLILSNAGLTTALTESVTTTPAAPYSISTNGCNGASVAAGASCTDVITFTGASAAALDANNAGTITFTSNELNGTTQTTPVTLSGIVTGPVATVTIAGDASVIYGASETYTVKALDAGGKPSASANGSFAASLAPSTGSPIPATVNLTDGMGSFLLPTSGVNVGSYTLSTSVSSVASNSLPVTVGKASLTAMANSVSRIFDTVNPGFTYSLVGLVNGDSASVVSGSASVTTSATRVSPYGTYALTPTGTLSASNYTLSYAPGTLTVTGSAPQAIVFTPLPALTHAVAYTLTGFSTSGLPLTYTATNASISGNVITPTAAGTVTVTAIQVGNSSYAAATPVSRTFTAQ